MITYATLSTRPQTFLAMAGLTPAEFRAPRQAVETADDRAYAVDPTADGRPRQRWPGAGRPSVLSRIEYKLLFVLVYLKAYPLQVVLGQLFGINTSQANHWLQHLLPVLRSALDVFGLSVDRGKG